MKSLMVSAALGLLATLASTMALGQAQRIDPATTQLPWMNSPAHDASGSSPTTRTASRCSRPIASPARYCNQNAPAVDALADEYKADARVAVLDLGLDSSDRDYGRWIAAHHPNHPVVKDVNHTVFAALKQDEAIPQTFVVACDGTLVASTLGAWDDAAKQTLKDGIAAAERISCN